MFDIPDDKAPGIDGFNSCFYKHCWDIVGEEISEAVLEVFRTGKLLKAINMTSLTLIPKVKCPANVSEFRPIACCSVLYKCITKLISEKLNSILPDIISPSQGAFVTGRSILHNVLICQDIVKVYKRRSTRGSYLLKLDLKKAYDTVNWSFLRQMMNGVGFPEQFTELVMTCVKTPMFSILINGAPTGLFGAQRGLRQGDPMSPLLFALGMDYLDRIMKLVGDMEGFKYHVKCKEQKLTNLCFADDLLLFCNGDFRSVYTLLQGFQLFSHTSGLEVNSQKSEMIQVGMKGDEVQRIMDVSGFKLGNIPFNYLGMPITIGKLKARDCQGLIDKMVHRIRLWSSRNLSFAARSQLINSVLMSIHVYWGQTIIIPKAVLKEINDICRNFLWTGKANDCKPGAVAWDKLCNPKKEGGLGFRNIMLWNLAAVNKLAWDIAQKKDNMWVKWVNAVYIREADWGSYEAPNSASWAWKFVCKAKNEANRKLGSYGWLRDTNFSIKKQYMKLKGEGENTHWNGFVWNRYTMPKHRMILWLAVQDRLKTRQRLKLMQICESDLCLICQTQTETCEHLFFGCQFSTQCITLTMEWLGFRWIRKDLLRTCRWIKNRLQGSFKKRVGLAAMAAVVYMIWKNRNSALWDQQIMTIDRTVKEIKYMVKHRIVQILGKKVTARDREWLECL